MWGLWGVMGGQWGVKGGSWVVVEGQWEDIAIVMIITNSEYIANRNEHLKECLSNPALYVQVSLFGNNQQTSAQVR